MLPVQTKRMLVDMTAPDSVFNAESPFTPHCNAGGPPLPSELRVALDPQSIQPPNRRQNPNGKARPHSVRPVVPYLCEQMHRKFGLEGIGLRAPDTSHTKRHVQLKIVEILLHRRKQQRLLDHTQRSRSSPVTGPPVAPPHPHPGFGRRAPTHTEIARSHAHPEREAPVHTGPDHNWSIVNRALTKIGTFPHRGCGRRTRFPNHTCSGVMQDTTIHMQNAKASGIYIRDKKGVPEDCRERSEKRARLPLIGQFPSGLPDRVSAEIPAPEEDGASIQLDPLGGAHSPCSRLDQLDEVSSLPSQDGTGSQALPIHMHVKVGASPKTRISSRRVFDS